MTGLATAFLPVALAGLALLATGSAWRDPRRHILRAAGWLLFGLSWPLQAPTYWSHHDPINAAAALLAPLPLAFFAWHELRSWRWGEDPAVLRWLAGITAAAAGSYLLLTANTAFVEALSHWVAVQSAWAADAVFGVDTFAYRPDTPGRFGFRATRLCIADDPDSLPSAACGGEAAAAGYPYYAFTIILACSSLHLMLLFAAAIGFTDASWRRRVLALAWSVPAIHVLNIFRNAGIVYGVDVKDYTAFGLDAWTWIHTIVGKGGSLLALLLLGYGASVTVPQLRRHARDLLTLPWRRPGTHHGAARPPPPGAATTT